MKKYRQLLTGFLVGAIIFGVTPVFAQVIDVAFNSINITVNGKKVAADNILYNGTTYVPLRAIAEMLNKDVGWDEKTSTASINDKGASQPSQATGYGFSNPAPIGTKQTVAVENILANYTAEVSVSEIIRGDEAWNQIKAANMFNDAPADGKEYILAKVSVKVITSDEGKKVDFNRSSFKLYSVSGAEYSGLTLVVAPKPDISTSLYEGASHEGWAVFEVDKSDAQPKISFGTKYDGTGGIWFKLYK